MDLAVELKNHPKFRPAVGMVGQDGSVIVRVGSQGPIAAYIVTPEGSDGGIEVFERRVEPDWLPDLTHPATGGVLLSILVETFPMLSISRSDGGCWGNFVLGDSCGLWANSIGESIALRIIQGC